MSDNLPTLDTPNVRAYFDRATGISHIVYTGSIDGRHTAAVYEWVKQLLPVIGEQATYGVIFDFSAVTKFAPDNLSTTRRESQSINKERDNSDHPVALVVNTMYQEQMVRVSTRISPQEDRKRIVRSNEEALAYFQEWHRQHP